MDLDYEKASAGVSDGWGAPIIVALLFSAVVHVGLMVKLSDCPFAPLPIPVKSDKRWTKDMPVMQMKKMAEDPLYRPYAEETAGEIWEQLSPYAKDRILVVLKELLPEDCSWYVSLEKPEEDNRFHSEENVSRKYHSGPNVVIDCIKNGKTFCMEYRDDEGVRFYKECVAVPEPYQGRLPGFLIRHSGGSFRMQPGNVIRSAYSIEELISD